MSKERLLGVIRFNSSRLYLRAFAAQAANSLPREAVVLDAGAGDCPYRPLFEHVRYEAADSCRVEKEYGPISYACDLTNIPVLSNRYDLVLLTQVLEHVPEPRTILAELHRVLKPGGELWLTLPLFFAEHEIPYDFYRYTQYGIRHLLQSTGYGIVRLEWLEGYFGTLAYQLMTAAKALPMHPRHFGGGVLGWMAAGASLVLKPLFGTLSVLFSRLDAREKYVLSGHCKNFAVVAVKRADPEPWAMPPRSTLS
jgi:SAM-dependent methyltransferase